MNSLNEKEAKQIAEDTKQFDESVSKIMSLAVTLRQERDKARNERDVFAGLYRQKVDLVEKYRNEVDELKAEDLKPALHLALGQRDVALRSVRKIHKISELINAWDGNTPQCLDGIVVSDGTSEPNAFDIVRHIKDVILKSKEAV